MYYPSFLHFSIFPLNLTTAKDRDPVIAADMTGVWNPLRVLDCKKHSVSPVQGMHMQRQKSYSDSELVAADMTNYADPVRSITSPNNMRRASSSKSWNASPAN
ncbi:hypothetical protein ElyMa_001349900 [Elysia marginata]|uniref:Uncharacterized protein n=1 Tax=Elysia marginata TaxID=1093978 RepID=A0AAV4INW2_9GAST|nr:hypothetical protein ElyMa_001349900 [Elysia marginata]